MYGKTHSVGLGVGLVGSYKQHHIYYIDLLPTYATPQLKPTVRGLSVTYVIYFLYE